MYARSQSGTACAIVAAIVFSAVMSRAAEAAPIDIEVVVAPKAESRLDVSDGSKRYWLATRREGKATGTGPLAGTTMVEWGVHDVNPATGAHASGYLVFTASDGDTAYMRYQFRAVPVPGADGKPRFLANGFWETAGGAGKLKGIRGAGTLHFYPQERRWKLDGEIVAAD